MISFWLSYSNDIISRDSTLYINIAQKYLDEGFIEAFKLWSWPFYAIFFAMLHQMTGLGLEYSAYLFSAILEAIICVVFVKIYCKIAFTEKHLWVAALFIITFTGFNAYRGDIIRGYGFWAFTLLAIYYYLSYYQAEKKIDAIKWQLSIFIATLFRPEAIVFAVAGPFFYVFLFAVPFKKRVLSFINLNSVNFVILAVILLAFTISSELRLFFSEHTPDQSVYFSLSFLLRNFNQGVENFIEHVLVFDYSAKYVKLILASGLTTMLIYKIILNLGIAYTALWSIGIYKKWLKLRTESWIILYFALIAFTVLMVLNITRFYVSSRYIVFLVILLGLVVSQYLDVLLVSLYRHKQKWLLWVVALFISFQLLDSIISTGASKAPIKRVALWAKNEVDANEKMACNEPRLAYYTGYLCFNVKALKSSYDSSSSEQLMGDGYIYLLLWVKHKNQTMIDAIENDRNLVLIKQIKNKKEDFAALYALKNTGKN